MRPSVHGLTADQVAEEDAKNDGKTLDELYKLWHALNKDKDKDNRQPWADRRRVESVVANVPRITRLYTCVIMYVSVRKVPFIH